MEGFIEQRGHVGSAAAHGPPVGGPAAGRVTVALPQDGRTGHVLVWFGERPRPLPAFKRMLRNLWLFKREVISTDFLQQASDNPIQCPRVRPDGTIEPPRLLAPESR